MSSKNNLELQDFVLPRYHVVSKSYVHSINAWSIEIDVTESGLTRGQCEKLIEQFRGIAGPGGLISIRKPSDLLSGTMQPWAVDRMDGNGILYNDYLFE